MSGKLNVHRANKTVSMTQCVPSGHAAAEIPDALHLPYLGKCFSTEERLRGIRSMVGLPAGVFPNSIVVSGAACRSPSYRLSAWIEIELKSDAAGLVHHGVPLGSFPQIFRRKLGHHAGPS
jgi:hypothetical protein